MTTLSLTAPEVQELIVNTELLKDCLELPHEVTINLQRTFKKAQAVAEEVNDARVALGAKLKAKLKKDQGKEKEEDVVVTIKDQEEMLAATRDFNRTHKFEVPVHLLKISSFPTNPKEFGFKEIHLQSRDEVVVQKRSYYEAFLNLIDLLIFDDSEWEAKTKEVKKTK